MMTFCKTSSLLGMTCLFVVLVVITAMSQQAGSDGEHQHGAQIPPWQTASKWPDRIITTATRNPSSSFSVTWRTDSNVSTTIAELVIAAEEGRFDLDATRFDAETEGLEPSEIVRDAKRYGDFTNSNTMPIHYHSVTFENLLSNTLYLYRVRGAENNWSEWFQIRTAPDQGETLKLIYFGDAQNGVLSHWSRVIRAAYGVAADAHAVIHAGDLVERGSRDYEWAEWMKAGGFIHGVIPSIPVVGNHEYDRLPMDDVYKIALSKMWRPQFTLPIVESLPSYLHETVYDVRFADVHLFILDTNIRTEPLTKQAEWLEEQLTMSDAQWKIVISHFPIFSSGGDRENPELREVLLPVLQKHRVDLVLQGHDHNYARGAIYQTPQVAELNSANGENVDMVFVNSVSGPKSYHIREEGWNIYDQKGLSLDRIGENTQFFQVLEIDKSKLSYRAYTAMGAIYDAFEMTKSVDGEVRKLIKADDLDISKERTFKNTGPDRGFQDLLRF